MTSTVQRARAFLSTAQFRRLWRYSAVSVISSTLTLALLFLTYHVLKVGTAMECNVISTSITTVPAFYLNRTWAWGKTGKSHVFKEVLPFWAIAAISLVLSTVAVGIAAHNADRITHSSLGVALVVDFANFATYGCIWVLKFLLFNRYLFAGDSDGGGENDAIAPVHGSTAVSQSAAPEVQQAAPPAGVADLVPSQR